MSSLLVTVLRSGSAAGPVRLRRSGWLVVGVLAGLGAALTYLVALPGLARMSPGYAGLLVVVGAVQLVTLGAALARPTRRLVGGAAAAALLVVLWWALARVLGVLPAPDPWQPVNAVVGVTDDLCAGLAALGAAVLAVVAVRGPRPALRRSRRVLGAVAVAPVLVVALVGSVAGVAAASDGFTGAGLVPVAVAPVDLPAGQRSTVEYCRPAGVPLAMDLYTPPTTAQRPAPVALYVHGGGLILGDRKPLGLGATLANQDGALFGGLQRSLNERGFLVASIDYRLAPATPWPAQIQDAACAVRFLRAHAADLGVDPNRIEAWGSSAGGLLVSLLGLATPADGYDLGQYRRESSAVGAVVEMFGADDLTDLDEASPFLRAAARLAFGSAPDVLHAASPPSHVHRGAPPFLVMYGTDDPGAARQSQNFAAALRAAAVPTTVIAVRGAGHGLDAPREQPDQDTLVTEVTEFLATTLARPR